MGFAARKLIRSAALGLHGLSGNEQASVGLIFGLAVPVLFGMVGIAVDYSAATATRSKMQAIADAAAINAAREFQMARASDETVAAVAQNFVKSAMNDVSISTTIDDQALSVRVVLEKDVGMTIGKIVWGGTMHLRASATAQINAKLPLCLLALDTKAPATVSLETQAQMTATGCMVYSDSTSNAGLQAKNDAVVTAGLICTAGGKYVSPTAKVTPTPMTDCPQMNDPLAARPAPDVGPCNFTGKTISGGTQLLQPGVYCGGLTITDEAQVTLSRGIYVIKGGPLIVNNNATLQGTEAAIYLKGTGANLTFDTESTISLSAPKDGPLAGILIYDDPTGASAPANPPYGLPSASGNGTSQTTTQPGPPREHKILSDNARTLLGTIYMPQGRLIIDATKPIADKSAYTVLVVRRMDLHNGPNLILNSDYTATDVPVPSGVGPYGKVLLTN